MEGRSQGLEAGKPFENSVPLPTVSLEYDRVRNMELPQEINEHFSDI